MLLLKIKMALSRLGFHVSYGLGDLKLAKKSNLDKQILKDMMYGCLKELGENKDLFYHSSFGRQYSHVNEKGKEPALEILEDFVFKIREIEEQAYEDRKKKDTFDALKQ